MLIDEQGTAVCKRAGGWEHDLGAAVVKVRAWCARIRTRRDLRELETHRLRDVGLTEADRRREVAKWFWQD